MSWLQLRLHANREQATLFEDALLDAGAVSVTLEDDANDPIYEPPLGKTPLWQNTRIIGLFEADIDTLMINQALSEQLGTLPEHQWEPLEDKAWERAWIDSFHPIRFGERLWVCPSWCEPPDPKAANLLLDPGLAFGTGTHPTTALCLEWLAQQDLHNKTVIDYGCGSGILGIAALVLGARHVVAIDIDPQALIATTDNAQRNNIDPQRITTLLTADEPAKLQADIVLANILAGPLVALAPHLTQRCHSAGQLVLSGLLASQAETVAASYRNDFRLNAAVIREEWARLDGQKRH